MRSIKTVLHTALFLLFVLTFASCIKNEALNQEADIVAAKVSNDELLIRKPLITNNEVKFFVNGGSDLTQLAPQFELTPGATIEPASGTVRNFLTPQTYTVTSEDGQWKKQYKVSFVSNDVATEYHFENIRWHKAKRSWDDEVESSFFHIFYELLAPKDTMDWGSGNAGFLIVNQDAKAEEYPTSQADGGVVGKCAKLQTVSTGSFGKMMNAPIAAGNLFTGSFQIDITNPAKSTRFGLPFRKMPTRLAGYYKYKAGETYTDKFSKVVEGKHDDFAIYAVLYEVTPQVPYLDGTNSLSNENIVLKAELDNRKETDVWTHFVIDFKPVDGRKIDAKKLAEGKYNLAIIMSSSKDGAIFNGAIGSTLYVDEMELYYK